MDTIGAFAKLAVAGALFAAPMAVQAQGMDHQAACPAMAAPLPADLAGWLKPVPLPAATRATGLDSARLPIGRAVTAQLPGTSDVAYLLRPEKPGGSVSHGGMFAFTVKEAGAYRVALGSAAWIDVVQDGKALVSTAHGHGPDCSGIRKMVDFQLTPGRYVLQVSANAEAALPLMVARVTG